MYEELVKRLRNCTSDKISDCAGCPYQGGYKGTYCMNGLITEAADAIEELQAGEKKFLRNISALETENENLKRARRWIPVTERLPEMGKEVLVSDKQKRVTIAWIVGCFSKDVASFEWACSDGWIDDQLPITHWMPLPEPPKEET